MEALWLIPVLALLAAALYFLVRSFIRLQASMVEVRKGLSDLGEMGPRLQDLGKEVHNLTESIEERRRQ